MTLSMEWREQKDVWLELMSAADQKVVLEKDGVTREINLQAGVAWQEESKRRA